MSKYLKTKAGSLESAVLEAVSAAQQAAIAIAKKEKGEKPKNEKTECPQCEGKGCDHCDGKGYHEQVDEKANFSDKQVKMAIGIASDKRYAGGNYTGAVKQIEKIAKGLSSHPQVAAVLKRQNEGLTDEELTAKQKKLDLDGDGDIGADDLAKLRKGAKKEEVKEAYGRVKQGHYDVKVTVSDRDVEKVKEFIMNSSEYNSGDIEDLDTDGVDGGGQAFKGKGDIFIQGDAAGDLGVALAKKFGSKIKVVGEETVKEELSLAQLAAQHITDMWKESAYGAKKKVDKKEEMDDNEKDGQTMTGKPMSKIDVNPQTKEK